MPFSGALVAHREIWVVPYKIPKPYPWINDEYARGIGDDLFIDCAVYGQINNRHDIDYSEILEKKTIELNGIKTLISRNHFDEDTFWKVYNRKHYYEMKGRLDPNNIISDLYKKFQPSNYRG